jgi:hypothetical protein
MQCRRTELGGKTSQGEQRRLLECRLSAPLLFCKTLHHGLNISVTDYVRLEAQQTQAQGLSGLLLYPFNGATSDNLSKGSNDQNPVVYGTFFSTDKGQMKQQYDEISNFVFIAP